MTAKALVIAGYGLNCEEETAFAFERAGLSAQIRHVNDLADNPRELEAVQVLCIPGGFSYGDDTGSGNAFAQKMRLTLGDHLKKFVERDTLTVGICNGCQIVANLGLAPAIDEKYGERMVAVTHNLTARYQCRWVDVAVQDTKSPWLSGVKKMHIPVAHGEGRFMMAEKTLKTLQDMKQIALRYVKSISASPAQAGALEDPRLRGEDRVFAPAAGEFPYNPNGSTDDIAGLTDPSGRVLILMPHPERGMFAWQRDDYGLLKEKARREGKDLPEDSDGLALFGNAAAYFEAAKRKTA